MSKNSLKRSAEVLEDDDTVELPPLKDGDLFREEFAPRKFLVYTRFNGQWFIHIREFGNVAGREYATKKGVCLTPGRLRALRRNIEPIDNLLSQLEMGVSYNVPAGRDEPLFKAHLGGAIFMTVSENYYGVNLRRYFQPAAQNIVTLPTKNGIYLTGVQWNAFKVKLDQLYAEYPELDKAIECCMSHGGNQMETFECRECTPFGYDVVD